MARTEQYSDVDLERETLAALLQDEESALRHVPQLLPKHFTDGNIQRLFILVRRFVYNSGCAPTREALRIELIGRYPKARETIEGLLGTYDRLMVCPIQSPVSFLVGKLVNFARVREALDNTAELIRKLDEGDLEGALKGYQETALSLQASDPGVMITRGEVIRDYEKRLRLLHDMEMFPDKYRGVLTGVDDIDRVTGGLWKGELGFVFGKSGVGKSFFLLEMSYSAFQAGLCVLVIPIEMPKIQWERRFDSRITHIEYERFKWARLAPEHYTEWERRIRGAKEKYSSKGGNVFISHIPMGCTLGSVRVELEQLKQQGTPADLLVIDYADLMSPPRQLYSEQGELTAIFRELKGVAGAYDIPVWTATQAKKESYKSSKLSMEDVGYAMGKVHVADLVIGLTRTDEDSLLGRMNCFIVKYRDGTHTKRIEMRPDFSIAMIDRTGL